MPRKPTWYVDWESDDGSEAGRHWFPTEAAARVGLAAYLAQGCTAELGHVAVRRVNCWGKDGA